MPVVNFDGPILATSTYVNDVAVQRNAKFEIPALTNVTAEIQAMGKHDVPLRGFFESAEYKGNYGRFDPAIAAAFSPVKNTIEHRWVLTEIDPDGNEHDVGFKCFITGKPKVGFPGVSVEPGNVPEMEHTMSVQSMFMYRDGTEMLAFDRFNQTYRVNGVDYYRSIDQYL